MRIKYRSVIQNSQIFGNSGEKKSEKFFSTAQDFIFKISVALCSITQRLVGIYLAKREQCLAYVLEKQQTSIGYSFKPG